MKETLKIETERADDIPLLLAHMQRMNLADLLDKHISAHGNRKGLSLGNVMMVWLSHILSEANHRMNHVEEWATQRIEVMRGCGLKTFEARDMNDDRLADVLRALSNDSHWVAFEQELMGHLVRVYDLQKECIRVDTTTVSSYAQVNEQGLLQLGYSKDHRPDLAQLKVVLASLDPLGTPLATEVLSGEQADDPVRRIGGKTLSATKVAGTDGTFHARSAYPKPRKGRATIACGEGHVEESHQFFEWSVQDVYGECYTA